MSGLDIAANGLSGLKTSSLFWGWNRQYSAELRSGLSASIPTTSPGLKRRSTQLFEGMGAIKLNIASSGRMEPSAGRRAVVDPPTMRLAIASRCKA